MRYIDLLAFLMLCIVCGMKDDSYIDTDCQVINVVEDNNTMLVLYKYEHRNVIKYDIEKFECNDKNTSKVCKTAKKAYYRIGRVIPHKIHVSFGQFEQNTPVLITITYNDLMRLYVGTAIIFTVYCLAPFSHNRFM